MADPCHLKGGICTIKADSAGQVQSGLAYSGRF
jgi:hypothetical protein